MKGWIISGVLSVVAVLALHFFFWYAFVAEGEAFGYLIVQGFILIVVALIQVVFVIMLLTGHEARIRYFCIFTSIYSAGGLFVFLNLVLAYLQMQQHVNDNFMAGGGPQMSFSYLQCILLLPFLLQILIFILLYNRKRNALHHD